MASLRSYSGATTTTIAVVVLAVGALLGLSWAHLLPSPLTTPCTSPWPITPPSPGTSSPSLAGRTSPERRPTARRRLTSPPLLFPFSPHHSVFYEVALSYPVRRSLTLSQSQSDPPVAFELLQEIYADGPSAKVAEEVIPTFHAYAKSGTAAGPVAYVNYGRVEDYAALRAIGIDVTGSVVLAKYGKIFRGDIVRNAEAAGALAAVVYTDRKDYGGGNGGKGFPEGRWMPPSGVQIGTLYRELGDPTTPGWPSVSACERIGIEEVEASGVLRRYRRFPCPPLMGRRSSGRLEAPLRRRTGKGNTTMATIQNVFGIIEGEHEPDRYVLLGNHRDAWTFGAVDPNSGTAALLEIAQRLEMLQKRGWKPRRTIVFCNWDAEEYGLIGSAEWVEENREMLASKAIAYLNVDCAVRGPAFHASATPQLDELLEQATKDVQDPDNSLGTLHDSWVGSNEKPMIGRLGGGGSDYAAFLQHAGVPSVAFYHSMYDHFTWMQRFGDPMFLRHAAAASIWGLVALRLADDEFLPFNYTSYARELQMRTKELEGKLQGAPISFTPLHKSIEELSKAAERINEQKKALQSSKWTKNRSQKVRELNDRFMMAERAFKSAEGLPGRPWYKHLVFGPSTENDYNSASFPGVEDAVEQARRDDSAESWRVAQHEVWRAARAVAQAALVLNGQLS
ncbi:unnamed protein product [Spirodela intermedia]|uniref:Uncharacterized protein n=1 Tax=Spirodela intermedia TaxID=51605 RepID=A0A7I8IT50_SPIIN|nr:unnamed protein product [Spirodela intermedia]CAA6660974.1 unnamed protein product [Spirodela intermedia]